MTNPSTPRIVPRTLVGAVTAPLTPEERRAKQQVLQLAERQLQAASQVRDRLRHELGLSPVSTWIVPASVSKTSKDAPGVQVIPAWTTPNTTEE